MSHKNEWGWHILFISVSLSDDPGAVHPCGTAQPTPPAGGVSVRRPSLPGSGNLRLEEEMLILLHPPPPRHHDRQPGTDHLDPQSHELHSGKRRDGLCHQHARVLYGHVFMWEFMWESYKMCFKRFAVMQRNMRVMIKPTEMCARTFTHLPGHTIVAPICQVDDLIQ